MEVDLVSSIETEQDGVEVDDFINNDGNGFGGERCGLCMDIIIDRGVLDCCQHWFCFGCVDNWATITNLCPLCQSEFQLITCVPVYDTIGSSKVDEDSYSRDDDWLVEGKNNTLSFPSYYIDENAVICLDGDGCKIRNGTATAEGDANLDTSIACDSCDLWYHAFCVGFDAEDTSENTWLCPRCVVDEMPQKPGENLVQNYKNLSSSGNDREQLHEDDCSTKVSVSVADRGETAIVVSMVGANKFAEEPSRNIGPTEDVDTGLKTQTFMLTSASNSQKLTSPSEESSATQSTLKARELELSLSCDTSISSSSNCLVKKELVTSADKSVNDHSSSKGIKSSGECANELSISNSSYSGSEMGLHLGLSMYSFLSADDVNKNVVEDGMNEGVEWNDPLEECKPTADKSALDADEDEPGTTGVKRKHLDSSDQIADDNEDSKTEIVNEISPKKMTQPVFPEEHVNLPAPNNSKKLKRYPKPENGTADIMSIVQGTKRRPAKGPKRSSTGNKSAKEIENLTGLRVKKIMKRAGEDNESSMVVQKLRKEIREAVRNKSVKGLGENLFDPKLLAAFRAAVAGPKTESVKMLSQLAAKAKKSMLQKGKVRENLTKKIYSSSNGRRKRAWDRDCEVEFWKHRCMRASKPEKIETLKSVLDLLRNDSESTGTGKNSERQVSDPILSRLYLADTSVFPRKDDIKPLAALKTSGDSETGSKQPAAAEKQAKSSLDVPSSQVTEASKVEKSNIVASAKDNAASSKVQSSKSNARKETTVKSADIKVDKRKWALEVLARRASGTNSSASEKQGDDAVLKGNYPLLAQLPVEMRPVFAPSRHNKIPMSVRQAQLYRLTEQLLRKANLPVIRRSAETELAVADAINIEREVADRSNSKPVYINLCAQELLHRSENSTSRGAPENDGSVPSTDLAEKSEQSETELSGDPSVQEALKNAGLLSDSPPNSPGQGTEVQPEEGEPSAKEEGPENVFEMDNVPDLDIYGEFEYSLDDEDYIGVGATPVSKVQPEEAASKMKLVFSTLNPEKSTTTMDSEKPESFGNTCVVEKQSSTTAGETGDSCVPQELLFGKEGEEPSAAECEELYGPDKEPLTKTIPMDESTKLYGVTDAASVGHNSSAGESSPNRSEMCETVRHKEKKSNAESTKRSDNSISKKVEAYIKEHIRPLCKSGIITAEQYRWAAAKTTEKVMKYHCKAKNANFLIKEGEKVKKLAEQYVEAAAKQKE